MVPSHALQKKWVNKHNHIAGIHDQASKFTLKEEANGNEGNLLFYSFHVPQTNSSPISNIKPNQTYLTPNALNSEASPL